jgi:hypothetical protein
MYDEIYLSETLIPDIAREIKKREGWQRAMKLADPSIFNRQQDGRSIADDYGKEGLYFTPANNDVSQGINRVNVLLKDKKMLIGENCVNWFWERDRYKWKDLKPGQSRNEFEEPTKFNDHLMDLTRYLANYIFAPTKPRVKKKALSSRVQAQRIGQYKTISTF